MKKYIGAVLFGSLLILGANAYFIELPMRSAMSADVRNSGVSIHGYAQYLVNSDHLIIDLWSVSPESSMADVGRSLFQTAESLNHLKFEKVTLAYRGTARFLLDGDYFQNLGREVAAGQNPMFLIRTLPQNVKTFDGRNAYSEWTGGLIGVLGKQMEDFNDFHRNWYLDDIIQEN